MVAATRLSCPSKVPGLHDRLCLGASLGPDSDKDALAQRGWWGDAAWDERLQPCRHVQRALLSLRQSSKPSAMRKGTPGSLLTTSVLFLNGLEGNKVYCGPETRNLEGVSVVRPPPIT